MLNLKNVFAILGLLLSFVTMAQVKSDDNSIEDVGGRVNLVGGTYTARIIAPKAIVYADENMLSPLGYIANGKAIIVGNPRRMNRDLVPLVIYGKLAFIEIKDIRYDNSDDEEYNVKRGAPREHNVDAILQKPEEKLSENNSIYFSLHRFSTGDETKQAFYNIEGSEESTFGGFNLQVIHRQQLSRVFWGAALDYSMVSTTNMKFGFWMLGPTLGYTPIKNKLFYIDIYGSLDLAINTEFEINNNYEEEPSAFVWGPQVNARIVFFPEKKYHLTGAVGFRKYSVANLTSFKDLNDVEYDGIKSITSATISIGLGMEFK